CGDSNVCTTDSCNEGTDTCDNVNNTIACDDTFFCTVGDTCANGVCLGTARDCADTNLCTTDSCDEGTDACDNVNNTIACDDTFFCTVNDVCANGACLGTARDCADTNACTTDSCDEGTDACENVNNTDPCNDADQCTTGDVCTNGVCTGVVNPDCGATTTTEEPVCPVCGNL